MATRAITVAAVLLVGAVAGCSSGPPPAKPQPGTLVAGTAQVTMTGATYDISGTADGFNTDNPSFRTGGTFAIKVAC